MWNFQMCQYRLFHFHQLPAILWISVSWCICTITSYLLQANIQHVSGRTAEIQVKSKILCSAFLKRLLVPSSVWSSLKCPLWRMSRRSKYLNCLSKTPLTSEKSWHFTPTNKFNHYWDLEITVNECVMTENECFLVPWTLRE